MPPSKILTTVPGAPGKPWGDRTTLASERCVSLMYGPRRGGLARHATALGIAVKMLAARKRFDVIVVDGGLAGQWFALLQSLLGGRKRPTLMIDCLWYRHPHRLKRAVKRIQMKLVSRSVARFAVWAKREAGAYAREFGIAPEKFVYIPFHTTLEDYDFTVTEGDFIFAGGNSERDYAVLIEAARALSVPVVIAATDKRLFEGCAIPPHVTVRGTSPEEFRRLMASCRIAVVPMKAGLLRSGGQQTFLNSMSMGKPTIIVGRDAAEGYVEHGVNGFVIDYGDVRGLGATIAALYADEGLRRSIGEAARAAAAPLTTDSFVRSLIAAAEGLAGGDRSRSAAAQGSA